MDIFCWMHCIWYVSTQTGKMTCMIFETSNKYFPRTAPIAVNGFILLVYGSMNVAKLTWICLTFSLSSCLSNHTIRQQIDSPRIIYPSRLTLFVISHKFREVTHVWFMHVSLQVKLYFRKMLEKAFQTCGCAVDLQRNSNRYQDSRIRYADTANITYITEYGSKIWLGVKMMSQDKAQKLIRIWTSIYQFQVDVVCLDPFEKSKHHHKFPNMCGVKPEDDLPVYH